MDLQKNLAHILSLHNQGENMERTSNLRRFLFSSGNASAGEIAAKLMLAEEIRKLYYQALRRAHILQGGIENARIGQLIAMCSKSLSRIEGAIRILNERGERFGIGSDQEEEEPETIRVPGMKPEMDEVPDTIEDFGPPTERMDRNSAEDSLGALKEELQHSLKALSNIVSEMDEKDIKRIQKILNLIIDY